MEPTPTADLDRTNDKVYDCTTSVVRAVMSLSQGMFFFLLFNFLISNNIHFLTQEYSKVKQTNIWS